MIPQTVAGDAALKEGTETSESSLLALLYAGVNSTIGTESTDVEPGLRAGAIVGRQFGPNFAVTGELTMDMLNQRPAGSDSKPTIFEGELAFSPLLIGIGDVLKVVVGPRFGLWGGLTRTYADSQQKSSASRGGVSLGASGGIFARGVGGASVGVLFSYTSRIVLESCQSALDGTEICSSGSGDDREQVLAATLAVLL